ncbi:FecR domain-containing protein [Rubripirellula obstinata]|uniref:FecR domain-containing protein n=1 Tax=Rubripirellula obstinata TaxID=406547 RepID=UPI00082A9168|nr:FecR domain-containing protein [Rubripirellula obstinata]
MISKPINQEEFDDLLGKLIDDQLSPHQHRRLESAITDSENYRKQYREMMRLHATLAWSRNWCMKDSAPLRNTADDSQVIQPESTNPQLIPSLQKQAKTDHNRIKLLAALLVLAASFLMVLTYNAVVNGLAKPGDDGVTKIASSQNQSQNQLPKKQQTLRPEQRIEAADLKVLAVSNKVSNLAVISDAVGVKWKEGEARRTGELLTAGPLRFDAGLLQLDFSSGARLVCRGPASLELISAKCVRIHAGEATCYVGELGKGFQVLTGESEVVDLGTSFGIRVDAEGESEVHVFDGAVSVRRQPESDAIEYTENTAVRVSPNELVSTDFSLDGFPKSEEIRSLREEQWSNRYLAWKNYAKSISEDPSVLVHYTFEDQKQSDIEVFNQSTGTTRGTSGTILRAKWCEGRWPNKKGLQFQRESDRVLLTIPGKYDKLSFVTWARPDAFLQLTSALLLTEHPRRWGMHGTLRDELQDTNAPTDTFRWVLSDRNIARLSLAFMDKRPMTYDICGYTSGAEPEIEDQTGKWGCYGVTIDPHKMEVSHFFNGKRTSVTKMKRVSPLPLETMEMGNHSTTPAERQSGMSYRFFGVIDELIVANRVFDSEEMASIYEYGRQDDL